MTRYDKLGRVIPQYDRSTAAKKGAKTKLKKDPNYFAKIGAKGGKTHGRGYLGKLKEEDPEKLASITSEAGKKRQAQRTSEGQAVLRETTE